MQNALDLSLLKQNRKDDKIMIRGFLEMAEKEKFNKNEWTKAYLKNNYKKLTIRVRLDDQNGVLDKINNTENVNEYIYNLILADIKKEAK